MDKCKVVLVIPGPFELPGWVSERLENAGVNFVIRGCQSKEELRDCAHDADIVWSAGGRRGLLEGDNLKVLTKCVGILRSGSGTDNVDLPTATSLGIVVCNTPDAVTEPLADHTISLLFSLVRRVTEHDKRIRRGVWDSFSALQYRPFRGATLGLVGFGRAPRRIIKKLAGFDMKFLSFTRTDAETLAGFGAEKVELDDLLKKSDYVSLHCALSPKTLNLIGERELRLMRPHALLINTSRGPVVDQKALIKALQEQWIAGAALDVLKEEPPAKDDPLLSMENVILTPHSGGHTHTYPQELCEDSVQALIDLSRGMVPSSVVNPEVMQNSRLAKSRALYKV
jgi:phosphoglycerate dehydrogenase-like enzyme